MDSISLTTAQSFELERMSRAIDNTTDPAVLQRLCKMLLQSWQVQRAATAWAMRQNLPPRWQQKAPTAETAGAMMSEQAQ